MPRSNKRITSKLATFARSNVTLIAAVGSALAVGAGVAIWALGRATKAANEDIPLLSDAEAVLMAFDERNAPDHYGF